MKSGPIFAQPEDNRATPNNNTTKKWHLALAGNSKNNLFLKAKKVLKERCHLIGYVPNNNMPEIINIADVVPIIQSPNKVTNMQIPAKLLEAMSLGKIIISTKVADIPEILGLNNNKQRGFIIDFKNAVNEMREILLKIELNPENFNNICENSKHFFSENASIKEIANRIKPLFID